MNIEQANSFADGFYSGVQIVSDYMKQQSALLSTVMERTTTIHRDNCLKGLFLRACAWIESLERLKSVKDFQAISAGNRALLEITVDILLLHHNKTNTDGWKMYWWSKSEKIRSAKIIIDYFKGLNIPIPDEYKPVEKAYDDEESMVNQIRANLWPSRTPGRGRHPKRWTGKDNLFDDIEEVDRLFGNFIKSELGCSLTEYYRTEYCKMNWQIHSGVTGVWNLPPEVFHLICGIGFKWCANLSLLCTKVMLMDFEFDKVIDLARECDNIKLEMGLAYIEKCSINA